MCNCNARVNVTFAENCASVPIGTKSAPSPNVADRKYLKLTLYTLQCAESNRAICMLIGGTVVELWWKLRLSPNWDENCTAAYHGVFQLSEGIVIYFWVCQFQQCNPYVNEVGSGLWRKLRLCPNRVENCAVRPIGTKIAPSPTVAFSNNLKLVLYTPKYPNSNSVIYMLIEGTVVVLWRKLRLLPN